MKIMEGSMETDDSAMTIPPKKKKLIQALLPFQMLGSSTTPNVLLNKKRKHMSPSPGETRNPKIVKVASDEAEEKKVPDMVGEKHFGETDGVEILDDAKVVLKDSSESKKIEVVTDEPSEKKKTTGSKAETKSGDITRYLPIVTTPRKKVPVVLLSRCDDEGRATDLISAELENEKIDEKSDSIKFDESSKEELAKELEDSEDDVTGKAGSEASSHAPDDNTDTDSVIGISSSDEETDERKKNKENEISDNKSSLNGTGLDKTPTSGVKTDGKSSSVRRLTPRQLEKQMETKKRRDERRAQRLEKEKKREEERLTRKKEKEARRREKKEKEDAEKEQKRKEKEQKELKKQMEIEQKQKEKERKDRAKEEDRKKREEAKEEEKRKKEEEKLEAERKKQKAASTFASFFVPKKPDAKINEEKELVRTSNFMPFEVKADMRIAPICRRNLNDSERTEFDAVCVDKLSGNEPLYVQEIKGRAKRKSGKTWPPESKDDDVVAIEEDEVGNCNMVDQPNVIEKHRAKLLAFVENRRPPYWGTWRKRSTSVTPRRPFFKDTKWFDYDVDSDEEWEEEEPGESLHGSDDEKDEENPDDNEYDVDNEFMVPHGYLSDEEAQADEDEEDMSPETQKYKLKILGEEFEAERKTQPSKIKPKVIGCIWQGALNAYPKNTPQKLVDYCKAREAWLREIPTVLSAPLASESISATEATGSTGEERRGPKKKRVPDEALPELIRLIHGNIHGHGFLVREFMTFWNRKKTGANPLSKSSVGQKIREFARRMACPEEGPMHLKACWYVSEDVRKQYLNDENLQLPNRWNYALTPKRKNFAESPKIPEKPEKDDKEKDKKSAPLITQYTKKITQEEMKKQLDIKSSIASSPKSSTSQPTKAPKRALLISVARGQEFPKNHIMNAFTKAQSTVNTISTNEIVDVTDDDRNVQAKNDEKSEPVIVDLECSTDSTMK